MNRKQNLDLPEVDLPQERLDVTNFRNVENRTGSRSGSHSRVWGSTGDRFRNERWRNSDRVDKDFTRNTERGRRVPISSIGNDDENNSPGADATANGSNTFRVPYRRDKTPIPNKHRFESHSNKNGNECSRTGRSYKHDEQNRPDRINWRGKASLSNKNLFESQSNRNDDECSRSSGSYEHDENNRLERRNWRDKASLPNKHFLDRQSSRNRNESIRTGKSYKYDESNRVERVKQRNEMPVSNRKVFDPQSSENENESSRAGRSSKRDGINRPERPNREQLIGYKYLKALSEKEPIEMICDILRPNANISVVLGRKELQPDWIMLIMETLRKLCESDFKGNRVQVLQYFCESPLLNHVSHYLGEIAIEENKATIKNLNCFVSNLVVFYSAVITTIPTVAIDKNFDKFLKKTKIGVDQMKNYLNTEIDEAIVEELVNLEKILEDETNIRDKKKEKPQRKYFDLVSDLPPPDDFRELSLYPTQEDLSRHDFGFVRPNKIKGAYEDVNHYLDVQFRLIREDFIDPLRRGLRKYKDVIALQGRPKNKYESVRFYRDARIENIEVTSTNQVAYVVNFDVKGRFKKIKWEYSKWFMFGSLLLFTRDNFDSFFFATVFNRDLEKLKKGRILMTLIGNEPLDLEMLNKPFLMAESEVYFEPYCLVMKALKGYNQDDFPMKQFIVDGNTRVDFPQYIINSGQFYIYDYSVDLVNNIGWPRHSMIGFDEHQFNAFKTALASNFTVIQGPPGTGKTYLGLKIVEVLLNNIKVNSDVFKTPILLVCYTNHALDQFLEGILKFTKRIVRVGGQSKSEVLKPFNLRGKENLSHLRREARQLFPAMNFCRNEMRRILLQLKLKNKEKEMIENPGGILSYGILSTVMNDNFKQIIKDEGTLLQWLLDISSHPSIAQNNSEKKIAEDVNIDYIEPMEVGDNIYDDDEDETMEADVLVNEDDVFDTQNINPHDMSIGYCISCENLENLLIEIRHNLEMVKIEFCDDYSEYYNRKHQLEEQLHIIGLQYQILNHFLQQPEPESSARYNSRHQDLWDIPLPRRWSIYWNLVSQLREKFVQELKHLEADYRSKSQQYEEFKQMEDFHVVKNALVVGMTTTCAARLQLLLKNLSPAIVIVEEAAEVLEAHIVVSLSRKCEHVILIGDHKQLKPSAAVYELSKKYNISVSLFERMINNNMYCPQLQIQHRMRPEISSLIVPSIYPDLKNHESVLEYPSVKGVTKNLFFVEHNVYEETVDDSSSRKNKFEADFMIALCRYILLQGYEADQITILTTYTGQMFLLREMKRDNAILKNVKVIVVDKYQGEENDIILLSLVRSNEEGKIGFLSIENRVCVALSRAKIGLYIIGNMDILSVSSLWKNIKEVLTKQGAIGPKLTLHCEKHDVYTQVSCKSDFNNVIEGGCHNFCHEVMECGHKCQLLCHKVDMEHLEKKCREKCLRQCVENHPCKKYCYEDCGVCTAPVKRELPCGHTVTLQCFVNYQDHPCQEEVSVVLEPCSHEVKKKCFQSMDEVECTFPCEDRLECGHQCVMNCHKTNDPDHLNYKCHKPCQKINRDCTKEHKCEKLCFLDCGKCKVRVEFTLACNHTINLECSANLSRVKCFKPCDRKCADCSATCTKKCWEDCKPCRNKVTKRIPDCNHEKKMECSVVPERQLCQKKCQRNAPCGHKCKSTCGIICGTERCMEIVKSNCVLALCGHGFADVPCWRKNERVLDAEELLPLCTESCSGLLKCGDLCTGTCGSCWQGRLHRTCQQKCGNVLICGHSCTFPCRNVCPPCVQKCDYACKHSKCPKNCGVPCIHCKEDCEWICQHFECTKKCGDICDRPPCYDPCPKKLPCKHDCIGYCGEPCPEKCRICDKEEVTEIVFGNEDEEDARFVLLEDCKHIIESEAMDRFISMPAENGEIVKKVCPLCKTPLSKTLRYMNQVKKVYRDIQNVKKKIYGDEKEMRQIRSDLTQKLRELDLKNDLLFQKELLSMSKTAKAYKSQLETRGKQSNIPKPALRAMHFFVDMFASIISRLNDLKGCAESAKLRIFVRLEYLLKRVNPEALLINVQQIEDIERELNRYHRIVDYGVFINKPGYLCNRNSPTVISINADIVKILYGLNCFDNKQDVEIGELFEKLQKETNSQPLSQEEKRMIHAAMAKSFYGGMNSQGHWFTCTKGHYYCITECGGAMELSKCPECGEVIGGRDHRYVNTARLASDIDGATRPAWSTGKFDFRVFRKELLDEIPEKVDNKWNRKGCFELKSLLLTGETFISITNRLNDNFSRITKEELKAKVMIKVTRVLQSFKVKRSTLKTHEVEFLDSELRRLYRYMHLCIIQCTPKFIDTNWGNSADFKSALALLESVNYSENVDHNVEDILKRFDQLQQGLTVREKESIREALRGDLGYGTLQGHWYSCRCGYVYTVANCGAFNQGSTCPSCRAVIGRGSSNTYVASSYWNTTSVS